MCGGRRDRHVSAARPGGGAAPLPRMTRMAADPFYAAKLATARFYFAKLLPETAALIRSARAGAKPLLEMDEALF